MDFINKLHHRDDDEHDRKDAAVLQHHADSVTQTEKKKNLFERLTGHDDDDAVGDASRKAGGDSGGSRSEDRPTGESDHDKPSFLDRITGKAEREEAERLAREAEEAERRRREAEEAARRVNPLLHLKDKLTGRDPSPEQGGEGREEGHKYSLLDKLTGKAAEDERRRRELEERRKNPVLHLKDKFDEALGGGRSAEEEEDLLDKAIDNFQEHILRKGPQEDESAWEQLKDDKIGDLIRKKYKARTGHEFPIKEKK